MFNPETLHTSVSVQGKLTKGFSIGKITGIWYQDKETAYDRVKFKNLETGEEKWYDTTQEVPYKGRTVAVKLNYSWFNSYVYLDENNRS